MSARSTQTPFIEDINSFFSGFFQSTTRNAKKRRSIIVLFFFLIWSFFALVVHPYQFPAWDESSWNHTTLTAIFATIPSWYFSLDVLFHLLFVFLGAIFAYQIASRFFIKIFGLRSGILSNHILLKIIFDFPREEPSIIDNSPILGKYIEQLKVIGGPAKLIIGAKNAAIFEKSDGSVQIVGPTLNLPGSYYQLESFDHLREIVDLRNQTIHFDVQARTKDGIPLMIKGVNAICSILRDSRKTTLTRPYSYNEQALFKFSYKMPSGILIEKITEILKQEFIKYIRRYSLSDLFENVGYPDAQKQNNLENFEQSAKYKKKRNISFSKRKYSFFYPLNRKKALLKKNGRNHKTNRYLLNIDSRIINKSVQPDIEIKGNYSNLLLKNFMQVFISRATQHGFNLEWISMGSIEFPSNKVKSHFQQVWQISSENEQDGSKDKLIHLKTKSEIEEFDSLFSDIFKTDNSFVGENTIELQNNAVLRNILSFLNNCQGLYNTESIKKRSEFNFVIHELEKVMNHEREDK